MEVSNGLKYEPRSYSVEPLNARISVTIFVRVHQGAVGAYVVDSSGLKDYRRKRQFRNYGPGKILSREYVGTLWLEPSAGPFFLVMENRSSGETVIDVGHQDF